MLSTTQGEAGSHIRVAGKDRVPCTLPASHPIVDLHNRIERSIYAE